MRATASKQQLLKRFHTMCGKAGLDQEQKRVIVWGFGVESSRDLSPGQLLEACRAVAVTEPAQVSDDTLRKRLIAAIGGYLRKIAKPESIELIKGIACRASKRENFNDIPREQLTNLYSAFKKKQRDFKAVDDYVREELETMTYMN